MPKVLVNGTYTDQALIDSGSTDETFISKKLAKLLNLKIIRLSEVIGMASTSLSMGYIGNCTVFLSQQNKTDIIKLK